MTVMSIEHLTVVVVQLCMRQGVVGLLVVCGTLWLVSMATTPASQREPTRQSRHQMGRGFVVLGGVRSADLNDA